MNVAHIKWSRLRHHQNRLQCNVIICMHFYKTKFQTKVTYAIMLDCSRKYIFDFFGSLITVHMLRMIKLWNIVIWIIWVYQKRCGVPGCHYMCGRRMVARLLASCPAQPSLAWCCLVRGNPRHADGREGRRGIQIYWHADNTDNTL